MQGTGKKPPLSQERSYVPYRSPYDPCPSIGPRTYVVPPNQYITFQPSNLPQFTPAQALRYGTLWPAFYSPYGPQRSENGGGA
ncbi:spore coat associated protein CotJA [Paenibacillus sp. 481]|nr:spore coat associated protein CotJA [Paenibacillus sp. 481]UHA75787.1 spore coat associated protein CotJA [Paenibacillus sp. 481]